MHYLALDTNTWIYLANGTEPVKLLTYIIEESEAENIKVLVPEVIIDEWNKNKDHAVKQGALKHFKDITEAFDRILKLLGNKGERDVFSFLLPEKEEKDYFKDFIEKFKSQGIDVEDAINENIGAIDNLFKSKKIELIKTTDKIILESARQALEKKAPFLKKNSFADAVILFGFLDYVASNKIQNAMFISYNTDDFCEKKDSKRTLHSDLVPAFEKNGCRFFHIVGEALSTIQKDIITQEELDLIREMQDESDDDSVQCINCDENVDRYSLVFFGQAELIDERIKPNKTQANQEELPFGKEFVKKEEKAQVIYDTIRVGTCDYCGTEHFICVECGTNNMIYDQEYGEKKSCEGCGLIYLIENEYDRKGMLESTTYTLPKGLKTCRICGEEYEENDLLFDEICGECEKNLNEK
jgi:hypothetical protein